MSDLVPLIWIVAILIALVAFVPYSVVCIHSAFTRNWKRLGKLIAAPVFGFLMLCSICLFLDATAQSVDLERVFDAPVKLPAPLYEYSSPRDLTGDGYTFLVYTLPLSIRHRFESPDRRLLTDFPKLPHVRRKWDWYPWRGAPFDAKSEDYLRFGLGGEDGTDRELAIHVAAAWEALSQKGTYYACFYDGYGQMPENIDLFIVDLGGGRLYIINHNT